MAILANISACACLAGPAAISASSCILLASSIAIIPDVPIIKGIPDLNVPASVPNLAAAALESEPNKLPTPRCIASVSLKKLLATEGSLTKSDV